jgi:hypothetical protein
MKTEYFYRTSRGATAMIFLDEKTAKKWYERQKIKFGKAMPDMDLIKRTIEIKDEVYEPASSTTCSGRLALEVSIDAKDEARIH